MAAVIQDAAGLRAGFGAPVLESQACFSALMRALAFPGRVTQAPTLAEPPDGWPSALAAAALTLLDADTPVWLDENARSPGAEAFLRFHTGAPFAAKAGAARFAILLDPRSADFTDFDIGTDQYPDRSATVLIAVDALAGGPRSVLEGPGIKTSQQIAPKGGLSGLWEAWPRNRALYPLGFDAFLFAGDGVIGLPRSVKRTDQRD
mgnify:CR=1 FL=1|jgi:alpha-D-ribose 1-methylphosphonate 5-triphosphate synthase subunit PhnH